MTAFALKKDNLYQELRQEILSGHYAPESRLPNELDFCRQLGVGKVTLRSALERLEKDGLVIRMPGKGTFVSGAGRSNRILVGITQASGIELPHNYILPGIEAMAAETGFETEVCFIEYLRCLPQEKALQLLKAKKLFGVLLVTSSIQPDDPEYLLLKQLNVPVVVVHGNYEDRKRGFALLYADQKRAWREGLEYLARKGHRRVRIINAADAHNVRGWQPEELRELFRTLGLDAEGHLVYNAARNAAAIRQTVEQMLSSEKELPSAVFCYSDFFAIDVMRALQGKGLRIPEDIAVMGFCGYPGDTLLDPPLSTVDFGYADIGRGAVKLLAESASWFNVPDVAVPQISTHYKIEERESSRLILREFAI